MPQPANFAVEHYRRANRKTQAGLILERKRENQRETSLRAWAVCWSNRTIKRPKNRVREQAIERGILEVAHMPQRCIENAAIAILMRPSNRFRGIVRNTADNQKRRGLCQWAHLIQRTTTNKRVDGNSSKYRMAVGSIGFG